MIINKTAGLRGDSVPWYFRKAALGPRVGKRPWGALVGILGYPQFVDGGRVTAPHVGLYGLTFEWEVENRGIVPNVKVELDPQAWRQGRDPQFDDTVEAVLDQLEKSPLPAYKRPAYPKYN